MPTQKDYDLIERGITFEAIKRKKTIRDIKKLDKKVRATQIKISKEITRR